MPQSLCLQTYMLAQHTTLAPDWHSARAPTSDSPLSGQGWRTHRPPIAWPCALDLAPNERKPETLSRAVAKAGPVARCRCSGYASCRPHVADPRALYVSPPRLTCMHSRLSCDSGCAARCLRTAYEPQGEARRLRQHARVPSGRRRAERGGRPQRARRRDAASMRTPRLVHHVIGELPVGLG